MKKTNYYFKIMGTGILLQALALQVMASHAMQEEGIGSVITRVEKKLNIKFGYDASISNQQVRENSDLTKVNKSNIATFIQTISNGELSVNKIDDKMYVITKNGALKGVQNNLITASTQQSDTKGKVIDQETGLPLTGVTIRILGTTHATSTDNTGAFSLKVTDPNAVVQISYIGYGTVEIPLSQISLIRLQKTSSELQEVVVTALGIKRDKKSLGYATQNIGGEELSKVKGVDIGTTLTGRISGVRVLNSTEFNTTPAIQVRGLNPILVIDGVLYENMTLRDIPTDNIADMNVLKGAAAAALYGERGSGGAIMITTKKGLKEKGAEINVNSNNMFFSGFLKLPEVQHSYSSGEGGKFNNNDYVWGDKMDIGKIYSQWNPMTKQMEDQPLTSRGKDNFRNFLVPSFISNNSLSFTNQGENGSVRTSISHIYNKGQYPNQQLNLTNISVTGTTKLSNKVDLETNLGYNRNSSSSNFGSGYNNQGYIYNILVWTGAEYDLRDYQDYWLVKDQSQNWMYKGWYDNPYLTAYEKTTPELINKINAAVTLNYKVNDWGKVIVRSGYDYYGKERTQQNPMGIYGTRGGFEGFGGFHNKGKFQNAQYNGFSSNSDIIFTAKKTWGDFGFDGMAGGSVYYKLDKTSNSSTVNGLSIPGYYSLRNSIDPISTVQSRSELMTNALYGRLALSWRNALFIEATGRNDWSSTLPEENRSYFYPSLSASASLTDLIDFKLSWLDQFKVRGAWVVTKKTPNPYDVRQAFSISNNVWDGYPTASYPNSIKDYAISPTQNDSYEFGFDFAVLKNRVFGNYTRYYRLEHNKMLNASISNMTGFERRLINTKEEIMTKGHEITVGGTPIKNTDFQWDIIGNLSQNMNYFHKLDPQYSADALYVKKGLRTDYIVSSDWERSPNGEIVHNSSGMPISGKYAGQLIGYTAPKWFWGLSNQFRYKDFQLSLSIDGRVKGMSYSGTNARLWQTGAHPDSDNEYRYEEVVNGNKTYIAPGVKIVSGGVTYDKYGQAVEDTRVFAPNDKVVSYESYWKSAYSGRRNYWDETFIKLRELSLSYAVPTTFANKMKAKKASIGITGQNLFLWTKEYKYADPDVGSEDLSSPSLRYIGFNINLTF